MDFHRKAIFIAGAKAIKAGPGGCLTEQQLLPDKRSRKVGLLPQKARMVLAASSHCIPKPVLSPVGSPRPSFGGRVGPVAGWMETTEICVTPANTPGWAQVVPSWYATGLPSATAAILATVYEFGGPNLTFLGHQAGLDSVINGCRQILLGRAEAMLVGGFDLPSKRFIDELTARYGYEDPGAIHPGV